MSQNCEPGEPLVRSLQVTRRRDMAVADELHMLTRLLPALDTPLVEKGVRRKSAKLRKSVSTSALHSIRQQQGRSTKFSPDKDRNAEPTPESFPRRGSEGPESEVYSYFHGDRLPSPRSKSETYESPESNQSRSLSQQQLPPTVKGSRRNDLLVGVVVSRWDNIVGPQSVYLWSEELTSVFYPGNLPSQLSRLVKYVTDHTVDHQTASAGHIPPTVQRTTLCIVPDLSLAYLSLSIRVPTEIDAILEFQSSSPMTEGHPDNPALTMPHSISVLSDLKFINQFLLLRPLMTSWLVEYGPQIGVLLCKENLQSSMINSWCAELCKTITALQMCWVQDASSSSCVDDSPNYNSKMESSSSTTSTSDSKLTVDIHGVDLSYLPPHSSFIAKPYLGQVITSHLTSFGSSIVVGFDSLAVNQVIRFLLCFATSQEGYCSRYALATLPDTFMKGLFIQGLILGGIGERSISSKQVASNCRPLTRIELGSKAKVKQTSISTHAQEREAVTMQELNRLWSATASTVQLADAFPNIVKDVAGFVSQFLLELEMLPPERRYGRLLLFRRLIHAKAISLITFLHSIQHKPPKDRLKLKQLIPQILGFDSVEYLIVQVTAEKIRPGVMHLLLVA